MDEIQYGYEPPKKLAEGLWEIRGEWDGSKLGRRMTLIRLRDNQLIIHNAIRLKKAELEWIKSLGPVTMIIAPNLFHCSDAGWMTKHFPSATLYVPKKKFSEFKNFNTKDVNTEFPTNISSELLCIPMEGTRVSEAAFIHKPSRTLILCDLAFNMADVFSGFEKKVMDWNKVGGRFGPSKITKILFTKNKASLLKSYEILMNQDFDRVIVNHGDVLERGGKALLRSGVQEIFG